MQNGSHGFRSSTSMSLSAETTLEAIIEHRSFNLHVRKDLSSAHTHVVLGSSAKIYVPPLIPDPCAIIDT